MLICMGTEGIVYVLTNPAMPGMVKIGKTGREVEVRLSDLYTTGVPLPFECAYAAKVVDMDKVEKAFHNAFGPYRVNPRREFFNIDPEQAVALLELMAVENFTPVIQEAADNVDLEAKPAVEKFKKSRRPNMNYMEMGIPPGSQLKFRDADLMCTVIDGRRIEYEGEVMSLSALTDKIVQPGRPLRPTPLWSFNGKNLADMYEETYGGN